MTASQPPTDDPTTREQRKAAGKAAWGRVPLADQGRFEPTEDRDPIGLLLEQAQTRVPDLVPIRHARMLVSPFTFLRGAALPMAADLAAVPHSGLVVQLCGDAHLSNFGAFASPERRLVFDINDFDETLPGPFEWDVKRLAASVLVAARENGVSASDARTAARSAAAQYRTAMRDLARMSVLDVWRSRSEVQPGLPALHQAIADADASRAEHKGSSGRGRKAGSPPNRAATRRVTKQMEAALAKARRQDSTRVVHKLTEIVDGQPRIVSDPPLITPISDLAGDRSAAQVRSSLDRIFAEYRACLPPDRQHLLQQFRRADIAHKVVGVGSVGTRAWVILLLADDGDTPLVLQAKQAEDSVLSRYLEPSVYPNQGQRVVIGQQAMQGASDPFLGWVRVEGLDGEPRDFYVRQLKDWKASADIGSLSPSALTAYARICGGLLARGHARTGDRVAIAAYLGRSEKFEKAITRFAVAYADQTVLDHAALAQAVAGGRAVAADIGAD